MPLSCPPAPSIRNPAGPRRMAGSATQKKRMEGDSENHWRQLTILFPRQIPKRPEEEVLPLYGSQKLPPREVLPAGRCAPFSNVRSLSVGGVYRRIQTQAGPIGISALGGREGSQLPVVGMDVFSSDPP